jgi:hypothetical protein
VSLTFIDTNSLPTTTGPAGQLREILNRELAGAESLTAALRWLESGQTLDVGDAAHHHLVYLMEGAAAISLGADRRDVAKGAGAYFGPSESGRIEGRADGAKLLHLVVVAN